MICTLLNSEIVLVCRSVVRFLDISVSKAMSCFFGCFRMRDDRSRNQLVSHSTHSKSREGVASQNRLSSLFLSEDKEDSTCDDKEILCLGSPQIDKGLKDEAKFLKACGTIPRTPVEIRKASEKLKSSPHCDRDSESLKYHSWLPNTSIKEIQLGKQSDPPCTPIRLCEELGRRSVSSEQTPSSCISSVQNTGMVSVNSSEGSEHRSLNSNLRVQTNKNDDITSSVSPWLSAAKVQGGNRSVRFECDFDVSSSIGSSESISQTSKKPESPGKGSVSKPLPNPTPLKLSDEMQTAGAVFPTNLDSLGNGKTRIRSQFLYSVMNPVENVSQLMVLKEEESYSSQILSELQESTEQQEDKTPRSEVGVKESSAEKELKVEANLSSWLKPHPSAYDNNNKNVAATSSRIPHFGRTPHFGGTAGDRPIIGMVAAHWKEDESSHISPKWWDGKGIPNSTNKYKEDQKVSWHATPFEERLEKALSEESFISQRKHIGPMVFDAEEGDSQLQPSPRSKSVVSF